MNELWKKSSVVPPGVRRPWKWPVEPAVGVKLSVSELTCPHHTPVNRVVQGTRLGTSRQRMSVQAEIHLLSKARMCPLTLSPLSQRGTITANGLVIFLKSSGYRCTRTFWVNGTQMESQTKWETRRNIWHFVFKPVLVYFLSLFLLLFRHPYFLFLEIFSRFSLDREMSATWKRA